MPLVSTLRPLVSKDPNFTFDRAVHSGTRVVLLVYPLPNAQKNYDNCANCARSRQACITSPPYASSLCQKCARQGRNKCPPHMSTTDAALWKKKDKEKRTKNKVTRKVEADGEGVEAFNATEFGTTLQSIPCEESRSNQPDKVTECRLDTVTSHPNSQHAFEKPSPGSQSLPDVQFQQRNPRFATGNDSFES